MNEKIFCLGFQKTGTNSVTEALKMLGIGPVAGYMQFRDIAHDPELTWDQVEERAFEVAKSHQAFQDMPWPLFYRAFDERYPDAKFILMIRETESWIESCRGDFGSTRNRLRELIYGVPHPDGHEDVYRQVYDDHNAAVQDHFAGRPGKLLVIRTGEAAWGPLCEFLGMPVPDAPWPRANTRAEKQRLLRNNRIKRKLLGLIGIKAQ